MSIKARRVTLHVRIDHTVEALLEKRGARHVRDAQLVELDAGLFDGEYPISYHPYHELQHKLRKARPEGAAARRAVERLTRSPYQYYLLRQQLRRAARRLLVPYVVDHIPLATPHRRRPAEKMQPLYLTVHSTGNPNSRAGGERRWLTNAENDRTASYHVVVDETQAIECIPFNEVAWHAGDGNGDGNKKSISMEICESGDRAKVLRNAIVLAARILRDADMAADRLRQHHDWAAKMCPRILIVDASRAHPSQTWDWFRTEVDALL